MAVSSDVCAQPESHHIFISSTTYNKKLECRAVRLSCIAHAAKSKKWYPLAAVSAAKHLEHLECSHQPHIQGRGAKKRTQRAG